MPVLFFHNTDVPLVNIFVVFKYAGSAYQIAEKAGVPHVYSYAVQCGAGSMSKTQFSAACKDLSMHCCVTSNNDNVVFFQTAPSIVKRDAFALFLTLFSDPKFDKDEWQTIQNSYSASMQDYVYSSMYSELTARNIFQNHEYGRGCLGDPKYYAQITLQDLIDFRKKFLSTSNAVICICGDLTKIEAMGFADKICEQLSDTLVRDTLSDVTPKCCNNRYYKRGSQSTVIFITKNVPLNSPKRYAADVLYRIFGENFCFKGRILSKMRKEQGLIYSGGIILEDKFHTNYAIGLLATNTDKITDTISILKQIIYDLKKNGITEEELNFAKNNIRGTLAIKLRTTIKRCEFLLNNQLAGCDDISQNGYLKGIDKVSIEDVNHVAKELLDNVGIITIGETQCTK